MVRVGARVIARVKVAGRVQIRVRVKVKVKVKGSRWTISKSEREGVSLS